MREVLTPVLGAGLATERANNIAQVLLLCRSEPDGIVRGMLQSVVGEDLDRVAHEVRRAWEKGLIMEQAV